jgi:HlyD family secretion protein
MDVPRIGFAAAKRRRQVWYAAGAMVLVLVSFGLLALLEPKVPAVPRNSVVIETVRSGTLLRQVRGPGLLMPEDQRWLTALSAGRVERIVRRPGDSVEPSSVVAVLSNPEVVQLVEDARLALQASEAETAAMRFRLNSELMQQRVRTTAAQVAAETARLQADAEIEAGRIGAVSRLQAQRTALQAAQLREQYEVESDLQSQLSQALQAQLRAQTAKEQQLRRALELRQAQESALEVRAGLSGTLQTVLVQEGQQVTMGVNIARVARPDRLMAQLRIPESQAKDLRLGLSARIDVRAGVVDGRVRRVSPTVEQGTVVVEVELLDTLPSGTRADTSIEGIIDVDSIPNAVFVARPAHAQPESSGAVFRVEADGNYAERVPVRFGKASVAEIIVLDGLGPGERIVVSDTTDWAEQPRIILE